ncbi:MAG: hypothetical protein PVG07_04005 [Acidobacteriota bacterium]
MPSEYDPVFAPPDARGDPSTTADLDAVRRSFSAAARPFLSSSLVWVSWAVLLPGAALATPGALAGFGLSGGLFLWSGAILLGGLVELTAMRRRGAFGSRSPLAAWALRVQGNLSLVGLGLSAILLWTGGAALLPGLWLLLLGHSFFALGGLAFRPMRTAGVLFQLGGAAALWPGLPPLETFAAAAAAGCLWMAFGVRRAGR